MKVLNTSVRTNSSPGFSLLEITVFLLIVAVALTATMSIYVNDRLAQRLTEERRMACTAAAQKIDEIRIFLHKGKTLDQAFEYYGPLPLPTGGPGATFDVPGLNAFVDNDPADGVRPNPRAIGTVTIINDESPNEANFGYDYANQASVPPFGVDINSNGSRTIETGFGANGAAGYNDQNPWPFPLDLNGNGSDGSATYPWDNNVVAGFVTLPVVITIQWQGAAGPQRYDLFTLIMPTHDNEGLH